MTSNKHIITLPNGNSITAGAYAKTSQFLISTENDLALFDVSGELVNQPHMGFGVEEIELV